MNIPKPVAMAILFAVLSFVKPSNVVTVDWALPSWLPSIGVLSEPSPFAEPGLHVLITYDNKTEEALPKAQHAALNSVALREWLIANCAKTQSGAQGWQIVDKLLKFPADMAMWQPLMDKPRTSEPWLYVGDGKRGNGVDGQPFPADEAALMAILTKYAGAK